MKVEILERREGKSYICKPLSRKPLGRKCIKGESNCSDLKLTGIHLKIDSKLFFEKKDWSDKLRLKIRKQTEMVKEKPAYILQTLTIENLNQNKCPTLWVEHGRNGSASAAWLLAVQTQTNSVFSVPYITCIQGIKLTPLINVVNLFSRHFWSNGDKIFWNKCKNQISTYILRNFQIPLRGL